MRYTIFCFLTLLLLSCNNASKTSWQVFDTEEKIKESFSFINSTGTTVFTRYNTPQGYTRNTYTDKDFGYHLQSLPLKPYGERVKYFNGKEKNKTYVYSSVIDLPIGTKDLHQCADATMRLRADYLYNQKRYNEIAFNFISDSKPRYYNDYVVGDYSKSKYWDYMEYIFMYANTASLKQQLKSIPKQEVQIGDILVQSGTPVGHAVIVVDIAQDTNGNKIALLAQSYMPAQELQILKNPNTKDNNPWYDLNKDNIITPEWKFTSADWKTW